LVFGDLWGIFIACTCRTCSFDVHLATGIHVRNNLHIRMQRQPNVHSRSLFRVGSQFFSGYFRESVPIVAQSRSLPLLSEVGFPPVLGLKAGRRVNGRFLPPRPSTSLASRYLTASAARSTARAVLNHPPLSFISHSLPCLSALTECDDPWRHLQAQLGSSNVCSSPMFLPNSWLQIYLIY
jgi:hypothetical protein